MSVVRLGDFFNNYILKHKRIIYNHSSRLFLTIGLAAVLSLVGR